MLTTLENYKGREHQQDQCLGHSDGRRRLWPVVQRRNTLQHFVVCNSSLYKCYLGGRAARGAAADHVEPLGSGRRRLRRALQLMCACGALRPTN